MEKILKRSSTWWLKNNSDTRIKLREYLLHQPYIKVSFIFKVGYIGSDVQDTGGEDISVFKTFNTNHEVITVHEVGSISEK